MAVASTVESMATKPVLSMTEMRTGPRSERNPTASVDVELTGYEPDVGAWTSCSMLATSASGVDSS